MLEVNTPAPNFTLSDAHGNMISLNSFKGKKVVLYFYPKDNTPGCTRQACAFKNAFDELKALNMVVIGISKDNVSSHEKFIKTYDLPFLLLSDSEHKVMEQYGAWAEKTMYGKKSFGVIRCTFVIDENGKIIKAFKKANPDTNAQDIVKFINNLS
jgi:peroxiredoxin Q/BCP